MAILNDDQKVIQEGRKNKLPKQVEESVRNQISAKLVTKLEEMDIGTKISEMWHKGNSNRQRWLDRQQAYLSSWDEHLEATAEGAWNHASTLHIPMPLTIAKTMHARFYEAVMSLEPLFRLKPRREDAVGRSQLVSDIMHYGLTDWCNDFQGIGPTMDKWIWRWLTEGSSVMKQRWDVRFSSFVDVQEERVLQTDTPPDNEFAPLTERFEMKETEVKRTSRVFEGPVFEVKNIEDILLVGGEGDMQAADAVLDRYWLTSSEMWQFVDRKVFIRKAVKEVIKGGGDSMVGTASSNIKDQRAQNAGMAGVDQTIDHQRYEIIESYLSIDVDGSGINSEVVVWVHIRSGEILRATYLNRINKNGRRPYAKIDFQPRHGQEYGTGLIEWLWPLSVELDAWHNIAVDYGTLSTMPFFFYRPGSNLEPSTIQLEPGAGIPVDNPQTDIFIPNMGNRAVFGMQQEASIMQMVTRLTGISDLNLGIQTGVQGVARTATGSRALLSESTTNLNVFLRRFQQGWKQALRFYHDMLQQNIPPGMSFRLTGEHGNDYWATVKSRDDLNVDVDFQLDPNSANSNPIIQQETSQQILQLSLNPILIQTQVVSVNNIYEAAKDVIKSLGVKDFGRFLTKPQQRQVFLNPKDEANRILNGIEVPLDPAMDHEGFIAFVDELFKSDDILGQFSGEQTVALGKQRQGHVKMQEAIKDLVAQANNARQAQINQNAAAPPEAPVQLGPAGGPDSPTEPIFGEGT